MPYYTHTLSRVAVSRLHPVGVKVTTNEHSTLGEAESAPGTTGDIFCDELTIGRTSIKAGGNWVNDWANPERATI